MLDAAGSPLCAGAVANDETAIKALLDRAAAFGVPALVVDQAGAQLVFAVSARRGGPVGGVRARARDYGDARTSRGDLFEPLRDELHNCGLAGTPASFETDGSATILVADEVGD